jgi:DNA polymerase-3 subunit epsilon
MPSRAAEPGRTRRAVLALLLLAAAGGAGAAAIALIAPPEFADGIDARDLGFVAALGVAAAALWGAGTILEGHWAQLRLLMRRLGLSDAIPTAPEKRRPYEEEEIAALSAAIGDAIGRWRARAEAPDRRLSEVLASLPEAVLVVTPTGLVSLVNAAAKAAFAGRVGLGTSIFDALDRDSFAAALSAAAEAGRPLAAELRDVSGGAMAATLAALSDGGAVLTCPAWAIGAGGLEQDLRLHERPPPRLPLTGDTPLEALPAVALDCETTGLDAAQDRIVSIAAVPMHGGRLFHADALDRLIDPGRPIPARSSTIHGITDAMVEGAPSIAAILPEIAALLDGAVLVGHSIGFDAAVLRREAARCGMPWRDAVCLDTAQLAAVLLPGIADVDLETVAGELGVSLVGRHTAMGDALAAGEIFAALLHLLRQAGARTLADAQAVAARAVHLRRAQRRAGW